MAKYHYRKYQKNKPKYVIKEDPYLYERIVDSQEEPEGNSHFKPEADIEDDVIDRLLGRSFITVIQSYLFRKNKGIKTKKIYKYDGYLEAQMLLNRSVKDAIKEFIKRTFKPCSLHGLKRKYNYPLKEE